MQNVTNYALVGAQKAAPEGLEQLVRVERPWGWYENLSWVPGYKVKRIRVHPGQQLSLQKHSQRDEHWVMVLGVALVTVGDQVFSLAVGGHVDIACGQVHRLANQTAGPVEIIELQFGAYLGEDDIVRLGDDYGRS